MFRRSTRFFSTFAASRSATLASRRFAFFAVGAASAFALKQCDIFAAGPSPVAAAANDVSNVDTQPIVDWPLSHWNSPIFLPIKETEYELIEREEYSPSAFRLRFALPDPNMEFHLPVCSTLRVCAKTDDGNPLHRVYTPITANGTKGYFDIVVRNHGGQMGRVFQRTKIGDKITFKRVHSGMHYIPNRWKEVVLLAGGVGITPCLQILNEIMRNPDDHTFVTLFYSNRHKSEALLYDEFMALQKASPHRFKFVPVFSREPADPAQGTFAGHITGELLRANLKPRSEQPSMHFFVSGGDKFVNGLTGVSIMEMKNWSSGRANQPHRFKPWAASDCCTITHAGYPASMISAL